MAGRVTNFSYGVPTSNQYIDQLLIVETAVVVVALGDRSWDVLAGRVDALPDVLKVDTTSEFSDEDRSHALGPELGMHTQEIGGGHADDLAVDVDGRRGPRDEADQPMVLLHSKADVPVLEVPGTRQRPHKKLFRVLEAELLV